jgi:hypothetical protein
VEVKEEMAYLKHEAMMLKADLVGRVDFMERVGRRSESGGGGGFI